MSTSDSRLAQTLILADNGSSRPESTRALRGIARALTERVGEKAYPVSLQHADRIPAAELDGSAANTFETFLTRRIDAGDRRFLVVPLFFGPSRALTHWIPEKVEACQRATGRAIELEVAQPLCPLPQGEPRLADILTDNLREAAERATRPLRRVVLVDHGSPTPQVAAVRHWLAERLRASLGAATQVDEAVMERRADKAYDFNGERLDQVLKRLAGLDRGEPVFLSMLFLAAGRHAGAGGDIDAMRRACEADHPGFLTLRTDLVGQHPGLVDVLADRVRDPAASV